VETSKKKGKAGVIAGSAGGRSGVGRRPRHEEWIELKEEILKKHRE